MCFRDSFVTWTSVLGPRYWKIVNHRLEYREEVCRFVANVSEARPAICRRLTASGHISCPPRYATNTASNASSRAAVKDRDLW